MSNKTLVSSVVGVSVENRQKTIELMVRGDMIELRHEPKNEYDHNAIAVWALFPGEGWLEDTKIGYLPMEIAIEVVLVIGDKHLVGKVEEIKGWRERIVGKQTILGMVIKVDMPDEN